MYDSYITRYFYGFVLKHGLPFAIVSDKFGLHFSDERLEYYDIHPRILSRGERTALGRVIGRKALGRGYQTIVFYNNSPLQSGPYFEMLSATDLTVYYTTKLRG
jgi:hypothetical protein